MREVDADGAELAPRTAFAAGEVNRALMRFNPIPNSCAAFRRDVALSVGGYDERLRYAMDHDLWLRIADTHLVLTLDEVLAVRRMTGSNVAARAERAQIRETLAIRAGTLRRRRTLAGATGLVLPAVSYLTPLPAEARAAPASRAGALAGRALRLVGRLDDFRASCRSRARRDGARTRRACSRAGLRRR